MTLNDKDYERINESAKTLQEYAEQIRPILEETVEQIRPILEEITNILLSTLNNEKAMQKLIDAAVKKAVQDAQEKQTYIDMEKDNDNNNDIN